MTIRMCFRPIFHAGAQLPAAHAIWKLGMLFRDVGLLWIEELNYQLRYRVY